MQKTTLKATTLLLFAALSLTSCQAVKSCFNKDASETSTGNACGKCGKDSCDKNCSSNPNK